MKQGNRCYPSPLRTYKMIEPGEHTYDEIISQPDSLGTGLKRDSGA